MLYVFHVDTGTMMTLDMNLTMEKVTNLQGVIARGCHIPEDKQVLLISGGESLDPKAIVGKYPAGTDTNPIFLFSKNTIEAATPPSPSVNYGSDIDLQGQVEGSLLMPPAYETVVSRAQLALQFQDVDTEELKACERLIHDQHLQQQGWAAVVANLEDITSELRQRSEVFHGAYIEYLESRKTYRDLIQSVSTSLQLLRKIPLLSCLTPSSYEGVSSDIADTSTLFDWISSQDTNHSLHDMVEQCDKATEQLDDKVRESLKSEVELMFKEVLNESMKEVKGLEDRLYGLDQIISGARKIVQEQAELAQGFVLNQNRLSNVRDRSILPDLCSSHRGQLVEMLKNHTRIREIKKKCRMAKEELSINLHTRLRWVMYVEKKICDVDGKLTIYLGNLKRLKKRLDILQQVHDAPKVYALLVIEVVRRKMFSTKFLSWATSLADDCNNLQTEEVRRRDAFSLDIGHHFLQSLFQGLEDNPPAFANDAPDIFDSFLPEITIDDIHQLKKEVPELCGILSVPANEDLFEAKTKDDKSHPGSVTEHHLMVPRTSPGTGSESDVYQNDRKQGYSLEGGSVSLGDQFTECERDEVIIAKPVFESFSPPDKAFLLAKSLSEELTQEMKSDKDRLKQMSGDKMKDSSSLFVNVPHKEAVNRTRKPSTKSNSEMSPDMETSQEFATADFYIDESMPSSIESPPKASTSTDSKTNLEHLLSKEKLSNEKLQTDLKDCYLKMSVYEGNFQSLREVVEYKLPKMKEFVTGLKAAHADEVIIFQNELEATRDNLIEVLKQFDSKLKCTNEEVIDRLMEENSEALKVLNEKLTESNGKCHRLQEEKETLNQRMEKINVLKNQDMARIKTEMSELEIKLSGEIKDLKLKQELELEVEVDKAQSDLKIKIAELEKQIETFENVVKEKEELAAIVNETVNKVTFTKETQTSLSLFQTVNCDTQTDEPVKTDTQVQTEVLIQTSSSMQTELCEQAQFATQTDRLSSISVSAQTATLVYTDLAIQTDIMQLSNHSMQTEEEIETKCVQNVDLSDFSVQTDSKSHDQMSTQTVIVSQNQLSTQTDKQLQDQSSTQTDKQKLDQSSTQTDSGFQPEAATDQAIEEMEIKLKMECDRKLAELEESHNLNIDKLISALEREKEDAQQLKSSLTSLAGDKQVRFAEAVNKVSQEKDRVIEELRQRELELTTEMENEKAKIERLKEEKSKVDDIKDRAMMLLKDKELEYGNSKRAFESEIGLARQQLVQYQEQIQALNPEVLSCSTSPSVINIGDPGELDLQQKIKDLEGAMKNKDDELIKMQQKVMELSMTASTRSLVQDKVSITSCHVGDLVLLCLDERLDQYVVFTVGTTLHFLHTDCLQPLGLKSAVEGRKQWLIAEVTDKEYCQAKKPNNRFKVPVGTKFYRVKAKSWTRDAALSDSASASPSH